MDIQVLDIQEMSGIAEYFVIVSGNSSTQVSAIADEVEDKMAESGFEPTNKEGRNSMRWILLDFDDIIVHVFHKDEREYYNIERLWSNRDNFSDKGKYENNSNRKRHLQRVGAIFTRYNSW